MKLSEAIWSWGMFELGLQETSQKQTWGVSCSTATMKVQTLDSH